jgi:lipoyl(octanoyl) transferase
MGVAKYIFNLESVIINAADSMGIKTERRAGITGVFAKEGNRGKIGAIGVRISKGITFHGFSFNLSTNLDHYKLINPCGMNSSDVSSVLSVKGNVPDIDSAKNIIGAAFLKVFK